MARKRTNTPTKPIDVRAQRSIDALHAAFLELLELKPLDQILLREITEVAGLSYPTFFRRFASKDELLVDIARSEVHTLLSLTKRSFDAGRIEGGRDACEYVQRHRRLWKSLLTGGAASAMREEFALAARAMADTCQRTNPALPLDLSINFYASCTFEIFAWWMRQPDDYPLNNVIKLYDAMHLDTIARLRHLALD